MTELKKNLPLSLKKILYRSTHRGTKELDILLSRIIEKIISEPYLVKDSWLTQYEQLLLMQCDEIYKILTKNTQAPNWFDKEFMALLKKLSQNI